MARRTQTKNMIRPAAIERADIVGHVVPDSGFAGLDSLSIHKPIRPNSTRDFLIH
jgi:hypothetical protein